MSKGKRPKSDSNLVSDSGIAIKELLVLTSHQDYIVALKISIIKNYTCCP